MPSRPEPVAKAGAIAGAVAGLVLALGVAARAVGWLAADVDVEAIAGRVSDVVLAAGAAWATVAPFVLALLARRKVTPVADPRDHVGNELAPLEELAGVDVGQALDEVLDAIDELGDLVAATLRTPAPSSAAVVDQADELVDAHLYNELAGGPPTVELEAVRVIDAPPPVPSSPAYSA